MAGSAFPWTDRAGRFSVLKAAVFAACVMPGLYIASSLAAGTAGPRPYEFAIHETGEWAVRFLLASLAVTPLRRILDLPKLILVRRMVGLTAFTYVALHLCLYVVDQNFDLARVASEIAVRFYLTVGFVAFLGLGLLAATSTDAAIRRLGSRWTQLHKSVYVLAALGLFHYFMQAKLDVFAPTIYAGIFFALMGYRLLFSAGVALTPPVLAGLAVVVTALTMALETAWFAAATGVSAAMVFYANFDLAIGVRPAWWVGAIALVLALATLARGGLGGTRTATPRPRRRASAVG